MNSVILAKLFSLRPTHLRLTYPFIKMYFSIRDAASLACFKIFKIRVEIETAAYRWLQYGFHQGCSVSSVDSIQGGPPSLQTPSGGSTMETAACRLLQCRFHPRQPSALAVPFHALNRDSSPFMSFIKSKIHFRFSYSTNVISR